MTGICGLPGVTRSIKPLNKANARAQIDASAQCPCGSGQSFEACCEPLVTQAAFAGSPEALMRSRYSAFVVGSAEYLLESWWPEQRPASLTIDPAQRWLGLKIKQAHAESHEGVVEFVARYKIGGRAYRLHERSRFRCHAGRWYYVDGERMDQER